MTLSKSRSASLSALAALVILAGCGDQEVILQGERLSVRAPLVSGATELAADPAVAVEPTPGALPFEAPAPVVNADWTHRSGSPTRRAEHVALSPTPTLAWTVNIGQGNNRKHRITSDPIVAEGRVYTLDSRSTVTAVSTAGATLWSRNLVPASEREQDASGGGLAFADGRIFATTGFGEVIAMDPATGAEIWRQALDAPATSSPTVTGGLVYAVSRDNRAWAIDAEDGRVKWQLPGTPSISGVVGGAGPAVNDRIAVFPFGSGELVAALRQGGVRLWGSAVSGKRKGRAYANITDITADPVIVGDVVYTGNQSGRAVALSLNSGNRIWTARDGTYGPLTVVGNSVFMITDQAELIRLDAETGEEVWSTELPFFRRERAKRSKAIFAHYGPVLAGGNLWVASDNGNLTAYDPGTGNALRTVALPGGAATNMAVAGGTMYVVSGRGQLHAYR